MNVLSKMLITGIFLSITHASANTCYSIDMDNETRIELSEKELIFINSISRTRLECETHNDSVIRCSGNNDGGMIYISKDSIEIHYINNMEDGYTFVPETPLVLPKKVCTQKYQNE